MTHHDRIAEMSRAIRAWCIARTPTLQDAEDLAQDVLLAMLEAAPNLREEGAFYGFMWGVAGNVYRQWAKRKARRKECELTEAAYEQEFPADAPEDVALLRRELTLIDEAAQDIAAIALSIRDKEAALLAEHAPEHLKSAAQDMAYFRLFDDAVSLPMARLYADHVLTDPKCADLLPTTYVVLAE